RHPRFSRDWSSDVCSSDLLAVGFGRHTVDTAVSSKPSTSGDIQTVKLKIVGTDLVDAGFSDAIAQANSVIIPVNSYLVSATLFRSEERRVGKERRSRWAQC